LTYETASFLHAILFLKKEHCPGFNCQNRHRLARLALAKVKAPTIIEAGAAGSFLLVTFLLTAKRKVTLSAAIPEKVRRIPLHSIEIASYLAMMLSQTQCYP